MTHSLSVTPFKGQDTLESIQPGNPGLINNKSNKSPEHVGMCSMLNPPARKESGRQSLVKDERGRRLAGWCSRHNMGFKKKTTNANEIYICFWGKRDAVAGRNWFISHGFNHWPQTLITASKTHKCNVYCMMTGDIFLGALLVLRS